MSKLAIFHPNIEGGGAERVLVNLISGLVEHGVNIDLVLVQAKGAFLSLIPPEVRVVDLGVKRLILCIPALVRYLKQERPTCLLSAFEDTNLVALWSRSLAGVSTRLVASIHNTLSWESQITTQGIKRQISPYLARWFYPQAEAIITVSQGVADDLLLMGFSSKKMQVIYNPVITPELFKKVAEPLHHPWFESGSPPVILGVGRLEKQKDFPTLVRAFARVQQKRSARLMILGEGEERDHLEALVQELRIGDCVALPGFVPNPYPYMAKSAVFVLSSLFEGLPTVLIEAMATGTRLVSTDCKSGPNEILANGKYGSLVPVGDSKSLGEAIASTLEKPPESSLLQQRAAEFSLEKAVTQYLQVLQL
ncbi:MAG TPA: glycosyl transferase [Cyanobacteria bacterium UBA11149]|nr:glycosyl transferase [Cyanobacteria bacterium UBA11367]HBE60937.1 glycosyl transferase [Cyanobacteria bacterium UBA11366]HBK62439.1 glycosyl transferase [Cyanobacteria bacterium UBA11166]HBR76399.1 glycosyl transferase [Cyanobacteria bacterium UBA11159]HBS72054.1 glycosyl transferase [Cyanobacteria bacterium UBA11153]HBW89749.1 glycosyl transferase [Cyanobacteria bacterium UBA11149]HCA95467.1 glycosyl transferase [Cyanobacteria bacterium UBA9226]